jgi:squalene-hopene/tetraprenyl-beta-curcumene cyclase
MISPAFAGPSESDATPGLHQFRQESAARLCDAQGGTFGGGDGLAGVAKKHFKTTRTDQLTMKISTVVFLCVLMLTHGSSAMAQSVAEMRQKAIQFLEVTQNEDGSWTNSDAVGITGLVTSSLLMSGKSVDDPLAKKSLDFLVAKQQSSGGIHTPVSRHQNYETCIAILALSEANQDGRYDEVIKKAELFLRGLQWDEGEGIETSDGAYGGGGYDSKQRPDLSNTQFLIEALQKAGVSKDDPAMKKALIFVSRAQNLESAHNQLPYAGKVNDGGFIYTPAKGGESKAGTTANGGHKSYGSITYAGLKSMIYAGLDKDDQRVKAATAWLKKHYTLDENPNMGAQGLFYYYQTMAKTLDVLGEAELEDANGVKHPWRKDLTTKLASLQQKNGSWVNEADRWYEGDPNLVTAYCLITLSYCQD